MIRRIWMATMVAGAVVAGAIVTGGAPAVAAATETRQFTGEGSSSFGPILAYHYAYANALQRAENAGFDSTTCSEVNSVVGPFDAWVTVECSR